MSEKRIKAIDGLRALALIEIVLYHLNVSVCNGMLTRFVITFFFILSGYMMAMRYGDITPDWLGVKHILTRRFAHFLPLYWLSLAAILLFSEWGMRWDLPLHVLLLQSWIPDTYYCFSYNEVAWFISTLLVGYICFPFINGLVRRVSLRAQLVLILTVGVAYYVVLYFLRATGYMYYICPATRLIDFVVGMTLFRGLDSLLGNRAKLSMLSASVLEIVAVAVVFVFNVLAYSLPNGLRMMQFALFWFVPVLMLIAVFGHRSLSAGVMSRVLSCSLLVKVGMLSMEIFILHFLAIILVRKVVEASRVVIPEWLFVIVALVVTLIVAMLAHRFIIIPVKNWLSRHCKALNSR